MKKRNKKVKCNIEQVVVYTAVVVILLLTMFNLQNFLRVKKVLGISINNTSDNSLDRSDREFWENFVAKNPNYIPGWIELGRIDKVTEIDPNYF
jgi:hypothetical protein